MAKTVLSIRDFTILYSLASSEISRLEVAFYRFGLDEAEYKKRKEEKKKELQNDRYYQDLLRLRDNLGELCVEIETPNVEVRE